MEGLALPTDHIRIHKVCVLPVMVLFLFVYTVPVYCQFADLPHDAKNGRHRRKWRRSGADAQLNRCCAAP